ncbi:helix-turn-helix domain-containing protein [Teredinibacter waterburyi]|nr:helix-turn-helix domain-containing protein [Teredinibacter waterburyi]
MTNQILALKEICEHLKLVDKAAYTLAADDRLPGLKVGGSWLF